MQTPPSKPASRSRPALRSGPASPRAERRRTRRQARRLQSVETGSPVTSAFSAGTAAAPESAETGPPMTAAERAAALQRQQDQRELICSAIGLTVKLGLVAVSCVSLVQLAGAYRARLDRHGELEAILNVQASRLRRAQERFDALFAKGGERLVIQEQDQWIRPDRLRVLWTGREATP